MKWAFPGLNLASVPDLEWTEWHENCWDATFEGYHVNAHTREESTLVLISELADSSKLWAVQVPSLSLAKKYAAMIIAELIKLEGDK